MRKNNYSTEEAKIIMQEQPVQKGRVRSYDAKRGYGWIYQKNQENGKEVYFRRDDLIDDSSSKRIRVGTRVRFRLDLYQNKVCARDIELTGHIWDGWEKYLELPNGIRVRYKDIVKYGKSNLYGKIIHTDIRFTPQNLAEHGYAKEDFEYVYIRTSQTEYKLFTENSPIKGDGYIENVETYLLFLNQEIAGMDPGEV